MAADSKDFELRVRARDYSGKTLEQVTDALRDLAKVQEEQLDAAKKGGASAKELEASYRKLESVVKALASQGALTKTYEAQSRALEEAKQRTEAARTSQEAYARALGSAADLTKAQVREQARLAAAVSGAERVQQRAQTRIEQTAQKLRAVGIATDDIAAAQRRIVVAVGQGNAALERQDAAIASLDAGSRRAAQSTTQVAAAVRLYGQASSDANKSALFGSDGGRGTVTLLQRIRTELLGVAAAYGSVQGAAGIAGGAVDAFNTRDGAKNQLALSLGSDRQAIDAEYQYVRAQSDRIGIEFERAIKGYAKFSAAATLAGRSRQEIRYIFETFSELGRVANLSKEDLDGVFKALEQITSKGKIQAEELRGQLGDNGVVNLRSGRLLKSEPTMLVSRQAGAAFEASAQCPRWLTFLGDIFGDDAEMLGFIQRACGYALTGLVDEEVLFFMWGTGANGKSVFANVLHAVFGEYAVTVRATMLARDLKGSGSDAEREKNKLPGARLALINEVSSGDVFDDQRVKELVSREHISARALYAESFEFMPSHKIFIRGNHQPGAMDATDGFWRRVLLIGFTRQISENKRVPDLDRQIVDRERDGILAWMVDGCLAWQKGGLRVPASVRAASEQYRRDTDLLGEWLAACCKTVPRVETPVSELFASYRVFLQDANVKAPASPVFGRQLAQRGFKARRSNGRQLLGGIELISPFRGTSDDNDGDGI